MWHEMQIFLSKKEHDVRDKNDVRYKDSCVSNSHFFSEWTSSVFLFQKTKKKNIQRIHDRIFD